MQGDHKTRYLYVTITNNDEPISLDNIYPVLRGTKPDGKTIFNECEKRDGYIIAELTAQALAVPGIGHFEIALYNQIPDEVGYGADSQSIATFPFDLHVIKSSFDATNMVSTDEFTVIEAVIANLPFLTKIEDVTEVIRLLDEIYTRIGNHTVKSDVPENALFTDTKYTISIDPNDRTRITLTDDQGNAQQLVVQYSEDAGTVNHHTVLSDVPADAIFTDSDTTYSISVDSVTKEIVLTDSNGDEQRIPIPKVGDAATVNGHTIEADVPADAVFTDTTYSPATSTTDGLMTSDQYKKLADIQADAEKNQNAISGVKVGLQVVKSTNPTDIVELIAGDNISLVPDVVRKTIQISSVMNSVHQNTEAFWNAQLDLIGEAGHIYVYTDHDEVDGKKIPGIKVGDGLGYLIDAPFIDSNASKLIEHIQNSDIHVSLAEKEFWNNKVNCFMSRVDGENIIFTRE
jgi:hypothetical protein